MYLACLLPGVKADIPMHAQARHVGLIARLPDSRHGCAIEDSARFGDIRERAPRARGRRAGRTAPLVALVHTQLSLKDL